MNKKEFDPIMGQHPDKDKIQCATCKNRLQIIIAGKDIGPANAYCKHYQEEKTEGKPVDVLFENATCKFYEKDA